MVELNYGEPGILGRGGGMVGLNHGGPIRISWSIEVQ